MRNILILMGLIMIINVCNSDPKPVDESVSVQEDSTYINAVLQFRRNKDNDFAMSSNSPFADKTEDFKGLKYFGVKPEFRVKAWLNFIPNTATKRELTTSSSEIRSAKYCGLLEFVLLGKVYHLPAMQLDGDSLHYFIMFKDHSNGKKTYGGGRYVEVPITGDTSILDFNFAYNPYCHYNHNYSCPLVPKEHILTVDVAAGEMMYGENNFKK